MRRLNLHDALGVLSQKNLEVIIHIEVESCNKKLRSSVEVAIIWYTKCNEVKKKTIGLKTHLCCCYMLHYVWSFKPAHVGTQIQCWSATTMQQPKPHSNLNPTVNFHMISPVAMLQNFTMVNIVNHKEDVVTYSKTITLTYITEVKMQQSTQPTFISQIQVPTCFFDNKGLDDSTHCTY